MLKILSRKNTILLKELVRTDFKLRYQGSVLGYSWSLLKPLFLFGVLYVIFGQILKLNRGVPHYPIYLLLGIVIWSFFTEITKQGLNSILSRGSLLRKIFFPSYIIVVSSSLSAVINFVLTMIVVLVFIIIGGASMQLAALVAVPLLIIELYLFSLGLAFILGAINVKYRDIPHVWEIVLTAGFYATPILYPLSFVIDKSEKLAVLMLALNPVAQIIQDIRYFMVTTDSETLYSLTGNILYHLIPICIVVLTILFAVIFFRKRSKYFTEEI